jgi:hypothetical protein
VLVRSETGLGSLSEFVMARSFLARAQLAVCDKPGSGRNERDARVNRTEQEVQLLLRLIRKPLRAYFSLRTPLKGALSAFWSRMRPVSELRLIQLPFGPWN